MKPILEYWENYGLTEHFMGRKVEDRTPLLSTVKKKPTLFERLWMLFPANRKFSFEMRRWGLLNNALEYLGAARFPEDTYDLDREEALYYRALVLQNRHLLGIGEITPEQFWDSYDNAVHKGYIIRRKIGQYERN